MNEYTSTTAILNWEFQFNYVNAIEYINWDTVCHSWNDIEYKIYGKWLEQEKMDYAESDEDEEDENDDSKFAIMDRIANRGIKGDC